MTLPIVVLNGWGASESFLDELVSELSRHTKVIRPVIKYSQSVKTVCQNIQSQLPEKYIICGWSLGGMLAIQLSLMFPQSVKGLMTIATNLQFVATKQWPTAMPLETFKAFEQAFIQTPEKALRQFSGLITLGDDQQGMQRQMVKQYSFQADVDTQQGLFLLSSLSYVETVQKLPCPALFLFGENDYLVPIEACQKIEKLCSSYDLDVDCVTVGGSGHIVFLPLAPCVQSLCSFLKRVLYD